MSTSSHRTSLPFEQIKGYLNQVGHHLLNADKPLVPEHQPSAEQRYLERLNGLIKTGRQQYLDKARDHYQGLRDSDLNGEAGQTLLADLRAQLNAHLLELDLRHQIDGKPRKSFMTFEAGFSALAHEAKLGVQDRLLHPQEGAILERVPLYPNLRPGLYALRFRYQEQHVELAGAFVVTEKNSPVASELTRSQDVGQVLLFTPTRGIESFDSLALLDTHLRQCLEHPASHKEFMTLLPVRYHALSSSGIWPLELSAVVDKPLFEAVNDALVTKRSLDIEQALSLIDNPTQDSATLIDALDRAISDSMPDLSARLELRAQTLLERCLRYSAPDWYRNASETARRTLAEYLDGYNLARKTLLDLLDPATTPQSLARYQWLERLARDLDILDLEPGHLELNTRRSFANLGHYEHHRDLIELALRGLHIGDEKPGSDFLKNTTLTYNDAPLPEAYQDVTPAWLAKQLTTLQPRIDFANVQRELHGRAEVRVAIEQMLDQRINALAYTGYLQNHLLESDLQLIQRLREGSDPQLSAATVGASTLTLHGAQLQDLWVLRRTDASGTVDRVLLCTPDAPRAQQFQAFDTELACRQHILGWALDNGVKAAPGTMTDYLITRVPLRFRATMKQVLSGLSLKFPAQAYKEVTFSNTGSHSECLQLMSQQVLAARLDDYEFSTPAWYRSTTEEARKKLVTAAENAEGALHVYNKHPLSPANFPSFTSYLHEQAKLRLNSLLGRTQNDVDPDTVWAHPHHTVIREWRAAPMSYTQLFRDGYADGIGFIDEKFSRSATFKGPAGIDLSPLTAEKVARSVTGVWIGQRYIDKVKSELLNPGSSAYALRRNTTLAITQQQMLSAALESRLKGDIAGVDLDWLEHSITSMADTSAQTRGRYAIHRLLIDGEWVIDTYLFSHADNPVLLYTPQAPDGISFREARQFNYLLKKQPAFIGYFTQRVAVQSQVRVRAFLEQAQQQLPEHLDRTSVSPARYDSTRAVPPVLDLRRVLYDMKLQRRIDDVSGTTVNRTQMITGILWTCVEWVTAIFTAPFPVLSLSVGMLLAFKDAMLALHAYNQGDTGLALEHLAGYLFNSAGGVFTDLRPALQSLKLSAKALRLSAAKAEHQTAMALISKLEPAPPVPSHMQPVIFNGEALWAPNTPDAIGRYLLYRQEPASGKLVSTTWLTAPDTQGRWVRTGVRGGAPKYEKVPESPTPLSIYEMPEKHWRDLAPVLNPQIRAYMVSLAEGMNLPPHVTLDSAARSMRSVYITYLQQVERLTKDAKNFFKFLDPLPAPAAVAPLEAGSSLAQLIDSTVFTGNKNLIIGAIPDSIASKQLLIEQMDTLIEKGFKRLYLEYLPGDVFRLKLEKFNKGQSWLNIERHLKTIDRAFGFAEDAEFSYTALLRKAQEKNVQIRALDASTSYQLDDSITLQGDIPSTTPRDNSLRNYYSHKVIQADMADAPDERWIALVDQSRLSRFNETPGLADLQSAVALRIEDVGLDQPVGIWVDAPGSIAGDPLARADYKLTLKTSYRAPEQPGPSTPAPTPGHFNAFDIEPSLQQQTDQLQHTRKGLHSSYAPTYNSSLMAAHNKLKNLRTQLKTRAEDFFATYNPAGRIGVLQLTPAATPELFLDQIFKSNVSGLVIGQDYSSKSARVFLTNQMKRLSELALSVKTLYIGGFFTDLHQEALDVFLKTQAMQPRLLGHLKQLRDGYVELIQAASKHGIRIRALDCAASSHLEGVIPLTKDQNLISNYFASQVIQADQAAHGPHKWIALVDYRHTNTYLEVPGLAQLQGAVSLHIRDTAAQLHKGIHKGVWETSITHRWVASRGDFNLDIAVPGAATPTPFVPFDRSKLTQTGHFTFERPSSTQTNLLHLSRTGEVVSTPIQVDDNGLFFIDRWPQMQGKRFVSQETLGRALEAEVSLTQLY